jgi:signal transduction histidine kinase/PAS domain-containing protein
VGLHLILDILIAIAYFSIPLTLIYFVRKQQDVTFNWICFLFSAFIVACGTTHLINVWTLWHPIYWLSGLIKAITAAVSLYSTIMLLFLLPKALTLPSIAVMNQKLEAEIAERQKTETALRESEARFQAFMNNSPAASWISDENGRLLYVSQPYCRVCPVTVEEVEDLIGKTDISERKQAEEIIRKQAQRELLLRVITQRVRQALDLDAILTTAAAEVRQTFQTERALIFGILPDGKGQVIKEAVLPPYPLLGEGSWIDRCLHPDNIEHYYITGQPRVVADVASDEWGECLGIFLHQIGVRSKISAPIIQTLENGSTQIWGFLIVHACGTYRQWLPEEARLLQQISNQLAIAIQQADLYQRVQTELAERKLAEEQLRQTNEQLANANIELARATRLKDEFLANMSHELRTPLNAILGMSEGLQEGVFGSINERQLKAIATIERSGRHLLELINDILDLSKIESGKLELQISNVPVRSLCDASLGFIRQMAQKKNIHLSTRIPDNVGSIQADERRLRQLLINLLSNAVKFTPEGGYVTLEVRLEQAEELGSWGAGEPPLILLAEDNLANLDTISGYIESRGYRLIVAKNGQQAIDLAQAYRPNLIVMDIQMPGMDGLEAMRHIRAEGQTHVPIIALTALAMPTDREKSLEAGANEYLTKPIKLKKLVTTIEQLLSQSKRNLL